MSGNFGQPRAEIKVPCERLTLSLVRHNRDKIVGNDREVMSIHGKGLQGAGTGIDESQAVLLALLEFELGESCVAVARGVVTRCFQGAVEVVAAVDEGVDSRNRDHVEVRVEDGRVNVTVVPVVVVREQERAEVCRLVSCSVFNNAPSFALRRTNIVVLGFRSMDDDGAKGAIRVLRRKVRVIPRRAV